MYIMVVEFACLIYHFLSRSEDMKVDVETYEVGPSESASTRAIDWRITSDSGASDSFYVAFSGKINGEYVCQLVSAPKFTACRR
jgi:hypothetical protein